MPIRLENVSYIYQPDSPYQAEAIHDLNLVINEGEFIGLIGHTGSGKSTLAQHLNGLLKPTSGKVYVDDWEVSAKNVALKKVRERVGLVFQYPEHQLFEDNVYKEIAFGPRNLGLSKDIVDQRVKKALRMVHLEEARYLDASPFELSGGEKRRIALAGVLAMNPAYLILDEPTAGLDPKGRREIMEQVRELHDAGMTVILISHSMDDVARLTKRLLVLHQGRIVLKGDTRQVFMQYAEKLQEFGLDIPTVTKLILRLRSKGWPLRQDIFTVDEARDEILKVLRKGQKHCLEI